MEPTYQKETREWVMEGLPQLDEVAYVRFASVYRRMLRAAAFMTPGETPITKEFAQRSLALQEVGESWLPDTRLNTFPEAGAQLASLILSPHRPSGCLLVVDVCLARCL